MTTPPPDGYETHLDAAVAFYVGAFDGCGKHLPPTAAAARAELAALREERVQEVQPVGSSSLRTLGHLADKVIALQGERDGLSQTVDEYQAREDETAALRERVAEQREKKNGAYTERNRLVALLASIYPSVLARHPEEDEEWEDDWRWIVFIELPTGQATWHIHDSHLPLFDRVTRGPNPGWDGHTTAEKYERVALAAGEEK